MAKKKSSKNGKRTSRYGKIRYVSYRNKKKDSGGWWDGRDAGL